MTRSNGKTLEVVSRPAAAVHAQVFTELRGHTQYVQALAFSPDSRWLVSGSEDGTIRVWDVATGALRVQLSEHNAGVNSVAYSADGARLLSASDDDSILVWDTATWTVERALPWHQCSVSEAQFAGPHCVVSAAGDGSVRLWSVGSGESLFEVRHLEWANALAASPDGLFALVASTDGAVRVWDLCEQRVARTLDGFLGPGVVAHAVWSADGRRAYTSSHVLVEWDTETWEQLGRTNSSGTKMAGFALVPGTRLAVVAQLAEVCVYDLDTRARVASVAWQIGENLYTSSVHMAAVSPDGVWVACGSQRGVVGLGRVESLLRAGLYDRHLVAPSYVAVASTGESAVSGGQGHEVRLWRLADGTSTSWAFPGLGQVDGVCFSRDGARAYAMSDSGAIAALDARTGEYLGRSITWRCPWNAQRYERAFGLRDGRLLGPSTTGRLLLWSEPDLSDFEALQGVAGHVATFDVDPREQIVVASEAVDAPTPARITAWNLPDRTARWQTEVATSAYAADLAIVGACVVGVTGEGDAFALDLDTGAPLWVVPLGSGCFTAGAIVRSGDGHVLIGAATPVRVELATGRVVDSVVIPAGAMLRAIPGDGGALVLTRSGVRELDPVALTLGDEFAVAHSFAVSTSVDRRFVIVAPVDAEHAGAVVVLRRSPVDPPASEAPPLEPRAIRLPDPLPKRGEYTYGVWTLAVSTQPRERVVLWADGGEVALALFGDLCEGWHYRQGDRCRAVWSAAPCDAEGSFGDAPWTPKKTPARPEQLRDGDSFEVRERGGRRTVLRFGARGLEVTVCDGRTITVARDSGAVAFAEATTPAP
ncbi:MAG: WD40 repeat domain-containing protein [Deltaproteobacteria bacterium]|nr:WD40 repeat domain-containing protein [Myxococcales bacterium]MDP3213107.1 WD40 repeat domain-containing protein [Deltaproteobacteria bacterium]